MPKLKLDFMENEIIKYFSGSINDNIDKKGVMQQSVDELKYYFKIYDKSEGTNHSKIIEGLYSNKADDIVLDKICINNGIYDRTLYRYRKKYVQVLEAIIEIKIW